MILKFLKFSFCHLYALFCDFLVLDLLLKSGNLVIFESDVPIDIFFRGVEHCFLLFNNWQYFFHFIFRHSV